MIFSTLLETDAAAQPAEKPVPADGVGAETTAETAPENLLESAKDTITKNQLWPWVWAISIVIVGFLVARFLRRFLQLKRFRPQTRFIFSKLVYFGILITAFALALARVGVEASAIISATGFISIAIGFAAQTSVSNLISGIFLIGEQPFVIGDFITVGDVTGEVIAVDLLSTKIRTYDNLLVRIPNETLINANVTNLTKFPIRRIDLQVGVAYHTKLDHAKEVLLDVALKNPLCLNEPAPLVIYTGFGDSSMDIQFSVWAKTENFLTLRNSIFPEIKIAFDHAGIEIPFPHRTIYPGVVHSPFPVEIRDLRTPDKRENGMLESSVHSESSATEAKTDPAANRTLSVDSDGGE
ncbi:MAG: mechanosensitive ion channel [Planctomycetes bacterium]|nr:mechanosensitive ion channel [Planctomycetota bacterium]